MFQQRVKGPLLCKMFSWQTKNVFGCARRCPTLLSHQPHDFQGQHFSLQHWQKGNTGIKAGQVITVACHGVFFHYGTFRENKTTAFRKRWMCHFYSQRTATSCKKIPRTEALLFMVLIWATYQGHFCSLTTPHCTAESSVLLFPSHLWSRAHYCHQHFSFPHTWHPAGQQHKGNTDVKR